MENNLQKEIDFVIHLTMLNTMLENRSISEQEYIITVNKLRKKTNCKLIVTSANY